MSDVKRNSHGCGPDCTNDDRCDDWVRYQQERGEEDALAKMHLALRNVRGLALKTAKANPETSKHLLRFCEEAGVTGSILRGDE